MRPTTVRPGLLIYWHLGFHSLYNTRMWWKPRNKPIYMNITVTIGALFLVIIPKARVPYQKDCRMSFWERKRNSELAWYMGIMLLWLFIDYPLSKGVSSDNREQGGVILAMAGSFTFSHNPDGSHAGSAILRSAQRRRNRVTSVLRT